jgi:2'-5' RNA ligase
VGDHFSDHEFTQPTELRDFFEWHQGIKHYGFWAIEIHNQDCLHAIKSSAQSLANNIHPNYLRQAHITLSASGLIDAQHFTNDVLQQQIRKLKSANLSYFSLCLSKAHSFTTAPYLSIKDPSSSLEIVRKLLHSISTGQDACKYVPHVTLGFYNNAYKTSDILAKISTMSTPNIELPVTEVVFARYNTHEIQGRYEVLHRISLNKNISESNNN